MVSERAPGNHALDQGGEIVIHPVRTLLYGLFVEPIVRVLQRGWRFVYLTDPATKAGMPVLLNEPIGPVALPSDRPRPKP